MFNVKWKDNAHWDWFPLFYDHLKTPQPRYHHLQGNCFMIISKYPGSSHSIYSKALCMNFKSYSEKDQHLFKEIVSHTFKTYSLKCQHPLKEMLHLVKSSASLSTQSNAQSGSNQPVFRPFVKLQTIKRMAELRDYRERFEAVGDDWVDRFCSKIWLLLLTYLIVPVDIGNLNPHWNSKAVVTENSE